MDEFSTSFGADKAGSFKLLDVVREGGRGNREGRKSFRAAKGTSRFGNLFEELKALWVSEGFEDSDLAWPRDSFGSG